MQKEFEKICIAHSTQIKNLEDKVYTLEKNLEKIEWQTEAQATAELQGKIILGENSLPPVSDNERCGQGALEVIRTKLNISLPIDVIVAAYRIGKKVDQAPDNRNVLIRFTNKLQRTDLITAAETVKSDDLFVSESLTPTRKKIANALRQAKKKFPSNVSGTYTQNGVPYVWIEPTGLATGGISTQHKIASRAMLNMFYTDTSGTPLDRVVNEFSD